MATERRTSIESSEAGVLLAALRDRLQRESTMPPLPDAWYSESAMVPAAGYAYGGDFFVARMANDVLQLVLVDACGHGAMAVPDAVQFAGALGAIVSSVPADDVMAAANDYVCQRGNPEGLTTAVHVRLRLSTGEYRMRSAGHPPVMHWSTTDGEWIVDNSRGTALGVTTTPDMDVTDGVLAPGEALMFYTDGLIEARGHDIGDGISQLRETARDAVSDGFSGATDRILAGIPQGEDDRAVMLLLRDIRG